MTVIATKNDAQVLSGLVMDDMAGLVMDFNYAHGQTLTEASEATVTIGDLVIWNTDHWELAANLDTLNGDSPLGFGLAIVVGFESLGDKYSQAMTSGNVVVLHQGAVNVKSTGLRYGTLSAAEQIAARTQLGKQLIKVKDVSAKLTSSFYSASV